MTKNNLQTTIFTILIFVVFAFSGKAQNCQFDKYGVKEIPTANQVVSYVGKNVRKIQGEIVDWRGNVVAKSVVSLHKKTKKGLEFIGSEIVGEDGIYCFKNMPNGKYVLKAGFNGFNRTEVDFTLNSHNRKAKPQLDIALELGT